MSPVKLFSCEGPQEKTDRKKDKTHASKPWLKLKRGGLRKSSHKKEGCYPKEGSADVWSEPSDVTRKVASEFRREAVHFFPARASKNAAINAPVVTNTVG